MKICYLVGNMNSKHGGGRYAGDLVSAIKKAGHEVVVIEQKSGTLASLFSGAIKIRRHIKKCDIVHAIDGYPYAIVVAIANIGLNKKLIVTIQGTYAVAPLYNFIASPLLKWAYKRADKIIAISRYTRDEVLKKTHLSNIEVINHGIDFGKFYKIPIDSPEDFILSVGALKYRKGYHVSIPAFAEAKKELPDLKYKIIGSRSDRAYFNELKKLAAKSGAENGIEFISDITDRELIDIYQRAKLFILASVNEDHHFEGFGLVFLEAAAAGLPVIGTLGNGIEDAIKNGYNGFLVPQNNIETTARAIIRTLNNESLRKEMSVNSHTWARERDWNNVVLKYLKVYESY